MAWSRLSKGGSYSNADDVGQWDSFSHSTHHTDDSEWHQAMNELGVIDCRGSIVSAFSASSVGGKSTESLENWDIYLRHADMAEYDI